MLHFICGTDRLCVSERVIQTVCARAAEGVGNQILIVPEQDSHEAERALCLAGGDTISRYAEVLSFSRLASRLMSVYGGVSEEYLDEGGRLLTMVLTVRQVLPQLKYFAAAAGRVEFLRQLGQGMEEFLSYGLSPEDFSRCAGCVTGLFAQKLTELGLIYESYLSLCQGSRRDPVTRQLALLELLRREDWAAEHTVYISGFSDFTGVQTQIVSELMKGSRSLTIAFTSNGTDCPVFAAATETLRRLKREADRCNVPYDEARLPSDTPRDPAISFWLEHEFENDPAVYSEPTDAVRLHHASGVREECLYVASRIRALLRGGCRCRELRVAVTDQTLLRELRPILKRSGIPAYYSGDIALLQRPLPAAVLSALRAVQKMEYEPVMEYLKSGFSPLNTDACDRVQEYAHFWNIQGSRWTSPWTNHPDGYGQPWTDESRQRLALLEAWRQSAIEPLQCLRKALREAANVSAQVKGLAAFLEQIELRETLKTQTGQLYAAGDAQSAQQTGQVYEILCSAMTQMELVLGEQQLDPEQFTELFSMLLSCCEVGSIPASVDEIQVGMLSDLRHGRVGHLFVLGAEEGKLPAYAPAVGLLRDDERRALLSMGLSLAPCDPERLERELSMVHQAFSSALESVTLCAASAQTSYFFERTGNLFPQISVTDDTSVCFAADVPSAAAALLRTGGQDAGRMPQELSQLTEELKRRREYHFTPLKPDTVRQLYGTPVPLSASRLDAFASCKYAFFLRYGLKLQPWKQAKFDAPVFGTFVHYVLECTVREVQQKGGFAGFSDEAVLEIADRHIAEYRAEFLPDLDAGSERERYLFDRNLSEVREVVLDVAGELRQSLFHPVRTELSFGKRKDLPPVRIDCEKGTALLSGAVDRVDVYEGAEESFYRVGDYKTGHKDFDYADILNGEGLQMLIYLFTLRRQSPDFLPKGSRPAGVLYVPGRCDVQRLDPGEGADELEKKRRAERVRKGLLLNEEAALHAMEPTEGEYRYLPHKARTGPDAESLASAEQLETLERFVSGLLTNELRLLLDGEVQPDPIIRGPMHSSCQYCDFSDNCHRDLCPHRNRYVTSVKSERFWEEVERRLHHG